MPDVGLRLGQNYPNPFNPSTMLEFETTAAGHVRLKVYDTTGRLVTVLVDEPRESGRHQVAWDGRDAEGRMSAAGVYLYRFEWGGFTETRSMVLVR
ncbi:MAG: FlgD immunoglobulin-like domain containing protein [bacterium]